jgi:hypothetical protein
MLLDRLEEGNTDPPGVSQMFNEVSGSPNSDQRLNDAARQEDGVIGNHPKQRRENDH